MDKPYAVLVVIAQDGQLVMPEYPKDPGCFVLPGGKVELGETPRETAEREVREETGLLVDVEREPFHIGESHNGKPMWVYRASWNPSANARLADEWRGPEGRVRLISMYRAEETYKPEFLEAFRRVMYAYMAPEVCKGCCACRQCLMPDDDCPGLICDGSGVLPARGAK